MDSILIQARTGGDDDMPGIMNEDNNYRLDSTWGRTFKFIRKEYGISKKGQYLHREVKCQKEKIRPVKKKGEGGGGRRGECGPEKTGRTCEGGWGERRGQRAALVSGVPGARGTRF